MRLSVLDQTPVPEGTSRPQALRNTLDLARLADGLGYHRYWLAEHHGLALAGPAPEVLAGPVAAATERIRVGSGGVMLAPSGLMKSAKAYGRSRSPAQIALWGDEPSSQISGFSGAPGSAWVSLENGWSSGSVPS